MWFSYSPEESLTDLHLVCITQQCCYCSFFSGKNTFFSAKQLYSFCVCVIHVSMGKMTTVSMTPAAHDVIDSWVLGNQRKKRQRKCVLCGLLVAKILEKRTTKPAADLEFPWKGANAKGGVNLLFGQILPKMHENWTEMGRAHPKFYSVDPPLNTGYIYRPHVFTPVILFTEGGVWQTPPSPGDSHCSGRYASYWNTFLYKSILAGAP